MNNNIYFDEDEELIFSLNKTKINNRAKITTVSNGLYLKYKSIIYDRSENSHLLIDIDVADLEILNMKIKNSYSVILQDYSQNKKIINNLYLIRIEFIFEDQKIKAKLFFDNRANKHENNLTLIANYSDKTQTISKSLLTYSSKLQLTVYISSCIGKVQLIDGEEIVTYYDCHDEKIQVLSSREQIQKDHEINIYDENGLIADLNILYKDEKKVEFNINKI